MGTILDYLREYGDYSLAEKPFCDVDSLVLSQLSYLKFDGIVPGPGEVCAPISLEDIAAHEDYDRLYADERYRKDNTALFTGVLNSRRFGQMRLWNYVNLIKPEKESQFSAVVCGMPEGLSYVVFRGTDENIVGWKEDLNFAFSEPVPGQLYSVPYLERAARTIEGSFYVGGHSKGGNLAVYAAMHCDPAVRERTGLSTGSQSAGGMAGNRRAHPQDGAAFFACGDALIHGRRLPGGGEQNPWSGTAQSLHMAGEGGGFSHCGRDSTRAKVFGPDAQRMDTFAGSDADAHFCGYAVRGGAGVGDGQSDRLYVALVSESAKDRQGDRRGGRGDRRGDDADYARSFRDGFASCEGAGAEQTGSQKAEMSGLEKQVGTPAGEV